MISLIASAQFSKTLHLIICLHCIAHGKHEKFSPLLYHYTFDSSNKFLFSYINYAGWICNQDFHCQSRLTIDLILSVCWGRLHLLIAYYESQSARVYHNQIYCHPEINRIDRRYRVPTSTTGSFITYVHSYASINGEVDFWNCIHIIHQGQLSFSTCVHICLGHLKTSCEGVGILSKKYKFGVALNGLHIQRNQRNYYQLY